MSQHTQKRDLAADRKSIIAGKYASVSTKATLEYLDRAFASEERVADLEEAFYNVETILLNLIVDPRQSEARKHMLKLVRDALKMEQTDRSGTDKPNDNPETGGNAV